MKKQKIQTYYKMLLKGTVIFALLISMTLPCMLLSANEADTKTQPEAILVPEPIASYDFEDGFDDLQDDPNFEIAIPKELDGERSFQEPAVIEDGEKGSVLQLGDEITISKTSEVHYSQVKLSNPFAGLADELQEYDELLDLTVENGGLARGRFHKYVPN